MALRKHYKTSENLEKTGIILDYLTFQVRVARAGGSNDAYASLLDRLIKPHKRAIQSDTMDRKVWAAIEAELYAKTVILDWQTRVTDEATGEYVYVSGLEVDDGVILPFTVDNVKNTLIELPELFLMIKEGATNTAAFMQAILEDDSKN